MINLRDADITKLMPPLLAKDIDFRCIAYAVQKEHQRIMALANATRLMSMIDDVPEHILDLLAIELRSPYYLETLDVEVKRYIVKRTLIWHQKAGTPNAVNELITIAFGEGHVVEWFDFTEPPFTPGTFDIVTNATLTADSVAYFNKIIYRVKNTRSHLRKVIVIRKFLSNIYSGVLITTRAETPIENTISAKSDIKNQISVGNVLIKKTHDNLINSLRSKQSINQILCCAAHLTIFSSVEIH